MVVAKADQPTIDELAANVAVRTTSKTPRQSPDGSGGNRNCGPSRSGKGRSEKARTQKNDNTTPGDARSSKEAGSSR
jgi:hypothetical protein